MAAFFFDNCADMRVGRWLAAHGHTLTSVYGDDFIGLHRLGAVQHAGILTVPQVGADDIVQVAEAIHLLVRSNPSMLFLQFDLGGIASGARQRLSSALESTATLVQRQPPQEPATGAWPWVASEG